MDSRLPETVMTPFDLNNSFDLTHDNITHEVFVDGTGPAVVLMHELPGMTDGCLRAAARVRDAGFRVYLPLFFGEPHDDAPIKHLAGQICIRREFNVISSHGVSRIAEWIRELCRHAHSECGHKGIGLIGMCFSGNIVLSVMLDPSVRVPVMCEPALPVLNRDTAALAVPQEDIVQAKLRAAQDPILAFRFATDKKCPRERFNTLRREFEPNITLIEFPTGPKSLFKVPVDAHSVLSGDYAHQDDPNHPVQKAFHAILHRFNEHLR